MKQRRRLPPETRDGGRCRRTPPRSDPREVQRPNETPTLWAAGPIVETADGNDLMAPLGLAHDRARALVRASLAYSVLTPDEDERNRTMLTAQKLKGADAGAVVKDFRKLAEDDEPHVQHAARITLGLDEEAERRKSPPSSPGPTTSGTAPFPPSSGPRPSRRPSPKSDAGTLPARPSTGSRIRARTPRTAAGAAGTPDAPRGRPGPAGRAQDRQAVQNPRSRRTGPCGSRTGAGASTTTSGTIPTSRTTAGRDAGPHPGAPRHRRRAPAAAHDRRRTDHLGPARRYRGGEPRRPRLRPGERRRPAEPARPAPGRDRRRRRRADARARRLRAGREQP